MIVYQLEEDGLVAEGDGDRLSVFEWTTWVLEQGPLAVRPLPTPEALWCMLDEWCHGQRVAMPFFQNPGGWCLA